MIILYFLYGQIDPQIDGERFNHFNNYVNDIDTKVKLYAKLFSCVN